jgi:hypothetical protein
MAGCLPHEKVCEPSTRCDGNTCDGGTSCDPIDGACKCGAAVCSDGQSCAFGQCIGGCAVLCEQGMSCDGDDQQCKCGGRGGFPCAADEICVKQPTELACRLACALSAPLCPGEQRCYLDSSGVYCAWPSALGLEGEMCRRSTECAQGGCAGVSPSSPLGMCRDACDFGTVACPPGRRCQAVFGVQDAGFCVP